MDKSAESLASLAYTRDGDGQVKTVTSKGLPGEEKPAYEYDSNNRLTKGATVAYEYDAANNPKKIGAGTYKYNAASQLETGPSLTYTYDELGERTKTKPTSGPATTYGYDQAGELTSVERPKEGTTPEIKDTYAYDGNGLRASQTISGTTTYLTWDMAEGLPLVLSDTTNSYIYGPGGMPVEQVSSGGTVSYMHHDQQGTTRLLTGSTGTSTGTFTYDAYGNQTGHTGTITTPLGYDAQYTSTDTGLIYMQARVYDPATAQFLSVDPVVEHTRATYNYAGNNPINATDPTGNCSISSPEATIESVNPFSEENCAYQGTKAAVEAIGANAGTISQATGFASVALSLVPGAQPVALALGAVSAATGAYAAGQEAGNGDNVSAALDGLGSVLGGTAAAEHLLGALDAWLAEAGGASAKELQNSAKAEESLAQALDKAGYPGFAASILKSLEAQGACG